MGTRRPSSLPCCIAFLYCCWYPLVSACYPTIDKGLAFLFSMYRNFDFPCGSNVSISKVSVVDNYPGLAGYPSKELDFRVLHSATVFLLGGTFLSRRCLWRTSSVTGRLILRRSEIRQSFIDVRRAYGFGDQEFFIAALLYRLFVLLLVSSESLFIQGRIPQVEFST